MGPAWVGACPWPGEGGASLWVSAPLPYSAEGMVIPPSKSLVFWPQGKAMYTEDADLTAGGPRGGGLGSRAGVWAGKETQHLRLMPTAQMPCVQGLACPKRLPQGPQGQPAQASLLTH